MMACGRVRVIPLLTFVFSIVLISGCSPRFKYDFQAGPCLNPVDQTCNHDSTDSRPMKVTLYPLRTCPDSLPSWSDIVDGKAVEVLGDDLLGNGAITFLMKRQEYFPELSHRLPPRTHCVLAVTIGRDAGPRSMVALKIGPFTKRKRLFFDRYNIFVEERLILQKEASRQ